MKNQWIQLVPPRRSLARDLPEFYRRNREFFRKYEPLRSPEFYSLRVQQELLGDEIAAQKTGSSCCFYIQEAGAQSGIIGTISLTGIIRGAFCSAFLGYKMDQEYINKGYMTMAVGMVTEYAFQNLGLHRIEANVMPWNEASLRVLEKNGYVKEGLAKNYLKINGKWEDHIHMVKLSGEESGSNGSAV